MLQFSKNTDSPPPQQEFIAQNFPSIHSCNQRLLPLSIVLVLSTASEKRG